MKTIITCCIMYFFIGTFFLIMFQTGYLKLDMQSKKNGEWLDDNKKQIFILSFCLWWPALLILLWKGRNSDED